MWKYKYHIAGILIISFLLFVYYGYVIRNAEHLCLAAWGDGYKNFYTVAYYLNYDTGYKFTGMNYPFSENVIYTDNQPAFTWLLKFLSKLFPFIKQHVREVILYSLFASVLVAFLVLFRLLKIFVPDFYAFVFAIFISLLAPQIVRFNDHYSLGYTFYFPILLLFSVRHLQKENAWIPIVWLTVLLSIFVFIHPYYFAISSFFLISLMAVQLLTSRSYNAFKLLIPVVTGFLIFKGYTVLTDAITDRPTTPWGFMEARSTIYDILLHPNSFIYQGLRDLSWHERIEFHAEGLAYIGVVSTLALLLLLGSYLFKKLRFARVGSVPAKLLLASFPLLLFAMAFPFSIHPSLEIYLDYFPNAVKQFRGVGRFSWIFFYSTAIVSAIVIRQTVAAIPQTVVAVSFLVVVLLISFIDQNTINVFRSNNMNKWSTTADEFEETKAIAEKLREQHLTFSDFQAILPVPYFNNGSEKIYLVAGGSVFEGMKWSLGSGLPLAATMMSRTSISQSLQLVNLFSSDYITKDIVRLLPSRKPFLLLKTGDVNQQEQQLIDKATFLFTVFGSNFYSLPIDKFSDSVSILMKEMPNRIKTMQNHGTYFSSDSIANVYLQRYENMPVDYAVLGKGAYYHESGDEYIYADTLPNAADTAWYELSMWMYTDTRVPAYPAVYLTVTDTSGQSTYTAEVNGKFSMENYKGWVRVNVPFYITGSKSKLYVSITGNYRTIDEFMIKPANTTVIVPVDTDSLYLYNNYPISYSR